ncbi:hypothetical protein CEXT_222351, partial [Caerostris extrusa]
MDILYITGSEKNEQLTFISTFSGVFLFSAQTTWDCLIGRETGLRVNFGLTLDETISLDCAPYLKNSHKCCKNTNMEIEALGNGWFAVGHTMYSAGSNKPKVPVK